MAAHVKNKEIQVQKPAQSLQAFQQKVARGEEAHEGLLKPIAIGVGAVLALLFGWLGWHTFQGRAVEKHEAAVSALLLEVQGADPAQAPSPGDLEKRMAERLPRLEALAKSAPSSRKQITAGILASWKLQLDGKGSHLPAAREPWDRVRLAQRAIATGQGKEAMDLLAPLRKKASPSEPWSGPYWTSLLEAHALLGQREQAWKDFGEYKARFKDQADVQAMERILNGV